MPMKRIYSMLSIVIVAFWLVMMGMLVRKHLGGKAGIDYEHTSSAASLDNRDQWAGIYLKDKKIGYSHTVVQKIEDGYQITEDVFMDMTIMDVPQRIETRINSVSDRNLLLRIFSFRLKSGVINFVAYGNIDGSTLRITIDTAGKTQKKTFQLGNIPALSNSLKYAVLKHGLATGTAFTQSFFDPLTMSTRNITIAVEGVESLSIHGATFRCHKIRQTFNSLTLYSWVDAQGDTIREESPMGLVLVRENEQQARSAGWGERQDILAATAVKVDTIFSKEQLIRLRLRLKNVSLDGFTLNSGRQQQTGDIIEITRENIKASDTYTLPFSGAGMEAFLNPTAFLQSDRAEIKEFAQSLIRNERDAQKAVRLLYRWVYQNIEKKPTLSIPSALEVLSTRQGDCNEHAVLLAALCRAAGIPARVCAGIVYLNGSFYYHAWVEVYLTTWVSVDPTLDQFPADVTHVKFVEGDMEHQIAILKLIGKLEIEVVEYL